MVSLETETDRTLFFDLLPIDVGVIGGFKTRLQLYTIPGQVFYNTTRKLVLKGVDGIVFVADSQKPMLDANLESFKNLRENLGEIGLSIDEIPLILQLNKRDLPNIAPVDDVLDIVGEEASEDIFRIAGSDAAELERRSPQQIALMRLPWVLATLVIELGAGVVIHYFDRTLSRVILLASFMPVIQAISGNTGLQSVTMVVRGLATGHVQLQRWWEPMWRQVQTTSIIGLVCGVLLGVVGAVWHGTTVFGLVVAVSMFVSVNLSGLAGTGIPMLSKRLGFDPALTAGPFETALQDVIGVSIFLSLATALLRWLA